MCHLAVTIAMQPVKGPLPSPYVCSGGGGHLVVGRRSCLLLPSEAASQVFESVCTSDELDSHNFFNELFAERDSLSYLVSLGLFNLPRHLGYSGRKYELASSVFAAARPRLASSCVWSTSKCAQSSQALVACGYAVKIEMNSLAYAAIYKDRA